MAEVKAPALSPALIQHAESVRNVWSVEIPPGIAFGSVLRPDFWAHCTHKFRQFDMVECRAQDNEWFAVLMVAKVGKLAIDVWPLSRTQLALPDAVLPEAAEYVVNLGGPQRWRIVRVSDKEVIHHGEPSKEAAEKWLADFVAGKVSA